MTETLCMVTRDAITWDDCLECAARGENTCGWDYALLRAMRNDSGRKRVGYHVTEIKACLRKAYYHRTEDQQPQYPSDRMYVVLGTMTHHVLEGSDHTIWSEVPVQIQLGQHTLYGTVDVYSPVLKRIVDYKTTRSIKPWGLPYGEHEEQVKIYTIMLRAMGLPVETAAIQYIDLSGPSKCPYCKQGTLAPGGGTFLCRHCGKEFENDKLHNGAALYEVNLDDNELGETTNALESRLGTLDHALSTQEAPTGETGWLCKFCSFSGICPEASNTGRDQSTDQPAK
jgi:CRISPR/Cas system-associated exonuclease Cas4 (RecB family)